MTHYIDLATITIDLALAQTLPAQLAAFYEAVPIAKDDDQVTVAMSHPDNATAILILERFLKAQVVPVRSTGEAIRRVLQETYPTNPDQKPGILAWLEQPEQSQALVDYLSGRLQEPASTLNAKQVDLDGVLAANRIGSYNLTVTDASDMATAITLLHRVAMPLLLIRRIQAQPRRLFVVLRGYASDELVIDWTLRLAQSEPILVVVMPIISDARLGYLNFLAGDDAMHAHTEACLDRLHQAGLHAYLTVHSGEPAYQIAYANTQAVYDLLIIAAEGEGRFVSRLLLELDTQQALSSILIVKPAHSEIRQNELVHTN